METIYSLNPRDTINSNRGLPQKTLILDLDETLVHSWENPNFLEKYEIYTNPERYRLFHPIGKPPIAFSLLLDLLNGKRSKIWGLTRPYLHEFLKYASEHFNVLIWSAGIRPYVEEITRQIFLGSGLDLPKLIWSRENCRTTDGLYHKPIVGILDELNKRSYITFKIDPKLTLIVDDKPHTFMENPENGILIPPFSPGRDPTLEELLDRSDETLLKLKNWLEQPEVKNSEDLRKLDKSQIFS